MTHSEAINMARTQRPYHHLIERDADGAWSPQFGDYHRPTVAQERHDMHASWPYPMMKDLEVVTTFSRTQLGHYKAIKAECAKRLAEHETSFDVALAALYQVLGFDEGHTEQLRLTKGRG